MKNIENIRLEKCVDSDFIELKRMHYRQAGVDKYWDITKVHDSVSILIYHTQKRAFVLVKQFRPPVYLRDNIGFTYELCAGILDKELSIEEIACEEILEEVGYKVEPDELEYITTFYTSVGVAGGKQTLYFCKVNENMRIQSGGGVGSEMIETVFLPIEDAKEMMYDESRPKTPGLLFSFMWYFNRVMQG